MKRVVTYLDLTDDTGMSKNDRMYNECIETKTFSSETHLAGMPDEVLDMHGALFSELWKAYQFMKSDPKLAAVSGTAKRLQNPDFEKFKGKTLEELGEMLGVLLGTHFHPEIAAKGEDQYAFEGHEGLYWPFVAAVSRGISYDEIPIRPHEILIHGYVRGARVESTRSKKAAGLERVRVKGPDGQPKFVWIPNDFDPPSSFTSIDCSNPKATKVAVMDTMGYLGNVCGLSSQLGGRPYGTLPHKLAEYDIKEMTDANQRPYLAGVISPVAISALSNLNRMKPQDMFPKLFK